MTLSTRSRKPSSAAMDIRPNLVTLISACFLIASSFQLSLPNSSLLGVSPQDEEYFATEYIACKDGSKSFPRNRLNDGFCDCADGTDEPGTSACPDGRFYCKYVESTPHLLFSSRVNDGICDCCDGSDEYDGSINCPNTCVKNVNVLMVMDQYKPTRTNPSGIDGQKNGSGSNLEDLIQKLKEVKIILMMEVVLVGCVMTFGLFRRGIRLRKRRHR